MPLPTALHLRRAQARADLHAGRVDSARDLLRSIVAAAPDDVEALLWLGDAELAAGRLAAAEERYAAAQALRPDGHDVLTRLSLIQAEHGGPVTPSRNAPTPSFAEQDLANLRRDLGSVDEGLSFVREADVRRAATLLDEIVNSREPAALIAARLTEIDRLLPALVELNVRAARREGQHEVAEALSQLLISLRLQRQAETAPEPHRRGGPLRALIVAPVAGSGFTGVPAAALRARGAEVDECLALAPERTRDYDVIIAHEPHADPQLTQGLALAASDGVAIVVSLACDYARLPGEHPAFHRVGLGSAERVDSFITALSLADMVVAPSEPMAEVLREAGQRVRVIAGGWARAGGGWDLPHQPKAQLSIGWLAGPGTHLDLALIRRELSRVLKAHPDARLVVAGDPLAYQQFAQTIADSQRQYLPPVGGSDRPYLLSQFDVLVQPLRPGAYAESIGGQPFIEAGALGLPWLASPTMTSSQWSGGLVAADSDAWFAQLTRLIEQPQLRAELAEHGRRAAQSYESGALAETWWRTTTGALPLARLEALTNEVAPTAAPLNSTAVSPSAAFDIVHRAWGGARS